MATKELRDGYLITPSFVWLIVVVVLFLSFVIVSLAQQK
jgi:hypothetical protein